MGIQTVDVVANVQTQSYAGTHVSGAVPQMDEEGVTPAAVAQLDAGVVRRLADHEVHVKPQNTLEPRHSDGHVGHGQNGLHAVQLVVFGQ